jgi:NADH:ubiquinone oxidoreductase subunit E
MSVEEKEKETNITEVVRAAIKKFGSEREALIPILSEVNRSIGYIPGEALVEIRQLIHTPDEGLFLADSHLYSIASFYHMLSLKPVGRHVVRFCESAPCHVMGGRQVIQAIESELGLHPGETSLDKKWTLVKTSCMGVCGVGPVFMIDDDVHGNVRPEQVSEILARYRADSRWLKAQRGDV